MESVLPENERGDDTVVDWSLPALSLECSVEVNDGVHSVVSVASVVEELPNVCVAAHVLDEVVASASETVLEERDSGYEKMSGFS